MSSNSIDDIINYAVKNNQKHVALIDINTMYGTMEFYNKAIAKDLLPIIGLKINYDNQPVYLIAKNNDGYHNLLHISSFINTEAKYALNEYLTGLIVIANRSSSLSKNTDFYSFDEIALQEAYFEKQEDVKYVKALMAIKSDALLTEFDNNHEYDDKYMLNQSQAEKKFSKSQLENLDKLVNSCSWSIKFFVETHFVKYDPKTNSKILLQTKCKEGLKQRLNSANAPSSYIERLVSELNVIDKMNFNDYFLVVQDYVNFAKRNGILVGPGRGSAAGSLVAYVLGITEIDPIKNDLIFERFLNPERATMPDIDIDFMDSRRDEIIQYLYEKYTKDRVAHILTFQRMKAKMAIRDAGRILGIELPIVNNISKLFNYENDLDIDNAIKNDPKISNFATKYPELFDFATKFTNYPRQVGLHAAGVVITNDQLHDFIPVQNSTDGIYSAQYSMEYLEPLGLIKMDILGLVNLTTIDEALKLIKINQSKEIDLSKISLNDAKVFKQLSSGDTVGIFQLESPGMRKLIMDIKPTSIEDISITSALFRPGPQQNIPAYLNNKAHPDKIEYPNDDVKRILQPTYNVIIYQEQVMQIVQQVGNYSLAQADLFRRAISKKNADKLALLEKEFINAAQKNKYSAQETKKIYDYIYKFANYGFNHSHSLAYSYISY
jgi:DNA polymerase-3 subunit alpha